MNVQSKIDFFKSHLASKYNISEGIINECFIPEETTDDIEIKGSVIMAFQMSGLYSNFRECVNEANKVFKHIYNDEITGYEITDFTKNNKDRFIESTRED